MAILWQQHVRMEAIIQIIYHPTLLQNSLGLVAQIPLPNIEIGVELPATSCKSLNGDISNPKHQGWSRNSTLDKMQVDPVFHVHF